MAEKKEPAPAEQAPKESNGSILAEPTPIPIVNVAPETPAEPVPVNRIETAEAPVIPIPGVLQCVECGQRGWKSQQALDAHIRFKHELPRARKAAADRKKAEDNGELPPAPPPSFDDITSDGAPTPVAQPNVVTPDARFEAMAAMSFDMTTGLLARVLGPEWLPNPDPDDKSKSTERATMVLAIKKYYASVKNLPDIPPGYMLCFVCLAYAAPRMSAQPTRTKLQQAWLWLKSKISRNRPKQTGPLMHIVTTNQKNHE